MAKYAYSNVYEEENFILVNNFTKYLKGFFLFFSMACARKDTVVQSLKKLI